MAVEESGFFSGRLQSDGSYDRQYSEQDFANYFANFIDSGVYLYPMDQLKVVAKQGLIVTVKKGKAFIDGYWYTLNEDKNITLRPNVTSGVIRDKICCTLNKFTRQITITTTEAASDVKPVLDQTKHELVLAVVTLEVGQSVITNANIDDKRPLKEYCGFVAALIKQVDFSEMYLQQTEQFNEWFKTIKGKLAGDAATALQLQIDELKKSIVAIRSGVEEPSPSLGKDGDIYIKYKK